MCCKGERVHSGFQQRGECISGNNVFIIAGDVITLTCYVQKRRLLYRPELRAQVLEMGVLGSRLAETGAHIHASTHAHDPCRTLSLAFLFPPLATLAGAARISLLLPAHLLPLGTLSFFDPCDY